MRKACANAWCQQSFDIPSDEEAFLKKMAFVFGGQTIELPPPTCCPSCRLQSRTAHRNERFLYRRPSDLSGKEIVSLYDEAPPWGIPYKVYSHEEWQSDSWDAMAFGKPYDFKRSFFEQWADLHKAVPRMGLITVSNENSDFTTGTGYCKNCYLINSSEYCEDCYYGKLLQSCKNCVDCSFVYACELCYGCINVYESYGCIHLAFSKNCRDCFFSANLTGCSNCLLCSNLTRKEYHIANQPVSKDEFQRSVAAFQGSHAAQKELAKRWRTLERARIHRFATILNSENCTGDYIENSKNCFDCFDVTGSEDCRHVYVAVSVKDNCHCSNMYLKVELCYEVLGALEVFHGAYCLYCFYCQRLLDCEYCFHCKDCFGCIGLKRKQYCIFNTQYGQQEYERLVPEIISAMKRSGEWGMYFPRQYAPFCYNESLANEYFPLTKERALSEGFLWRETHGRMPDVARAISADQLPDGIDGTPDDILNWAITCERTNRPFRLIKQELEFYRRQRLPVPRLHPDVRYDERLKWRNPRKLWRRQCAKCGRAIQTTYSPDRPETLYCEQCYSKEVY